MHNHLQINFCACELKSMIHLECNLHQLVRNPVGFFLNHPSTTAGPTKEAAIQQDPVSCFPVSFLKIFVKYYVALKFGGNDVW